MKFTCRAALAAELAALGAFFDPAGMTARETMLPEAATRAGWTLDHANSVYEAVFNLAYAAGPLGLIVAGPLADAAGLRTTFLALSLPMILLGVVAAFLPALRELDHPPHIAGQLRQ